jgi:hypothetical protein
MSYKIIKTIEDNKSEEETSLILIVETEHEHVAVDFENSRYTKVNRFRFESGFIRLDNDTKIELTRVLMSCEKDHAHGVYYQAPRALELWEAMFLIGEVNPVEGDIFKSEEKDNGTVS